MQSIIIRAGLKKTPTDPQWLEQRSGENARFLEGSQRRLEELEQAWSKKQPQYEQQLEREGEQIREARKYLRVLDENPDHFQKIWQREDQAFRQELHRREQDQRRSRDRDRGGWTR